MKKDTPTVKVKQSHIDWLCRRAVRSDPFRDFTDHELWLLDDVARSELSRCEAQIDFARFDPDLSNRIDRLRIIEEQLHDCLRQRFGVAGQENWR